jgi:hypothetical protein
MGTAPLSFPRFFAARKEEIAEHCCVWAKVGADEPLSEASSHAKGCENYSKLSITVVISGIEGAQWRTSGRLIARCNSAPGAVQGAWLSVWSSCMAGRVGWLGDLPRVAMQGDEHEREWRHVDRPIDQVGQVIDMVLARGATPRQLAAWSTGPSGRPQARRSRWSPIGRRPTRSWLRRLLAAAWRRTQRSATNQVEADHSRLTARLGRRWERMRDRNARVVIAGHALVQNVRRGQYKLAAEEPTNRQVGVVFDALAMAI